MKKSSHMTVSQSSTYNKIEPPMQAKEGVVSSSTNRIVLVHKQHSGLRGSDEHGGHLSGQRSIPKVAQASNRRSKTSLQQAAPVWPAANVNTLLQKMKEEDGNQESKVVYKASKRHGNGPVLSVKSDILVELEQLRKQRELKQAAALAERKEIESRFFTTEVKTALPEGRERPVVEFPMRNTRLSQAARASMTVDTPAPEELQPKAESPQNQTSGKLEIPEDLIAPALMDESS